MLEARSLTKYYNHIPAVCEVSFTVRQFLRLLGLSGLDVTSALVVEKICSGVLILREGEVVAYDSIHRLRELMSQPSLEGVFAQLAEVEDSDTLANRVLDAMSRHEG